MRSRNRYLQWGVVAVIVGAAVHVGCSESLHEEPSVSGVMSVVGAHSASFQDGVVPTSGYAGTRDTMLEEHASSATHGSDTSLSISGDTPGGSGDDDVVLLRWDVSATIPSNAIVRSATIKVTVSDKAEQTYELYEGLRAWDEGGASWNQASSGVAWGTAGAKAATDRGSIALGGIAASSTGDKTITLNAGGLAAVQRWVSSPSSNRGLVIADASNDNRLEIRSSEYRTKSSRPKLTVTWDAAAPVPDAGSDAGFSLVQTPGKYQSTCDGSGAIAIDGRHFLDVNDETQTIRIYTQGAQATPVQQLDVSGALGLSSSDETDMEDAARVGNRVYVVGSHGRDKSGNLELTRYKFFGIDLAGAVPSLTMAVAGSYGDLLVDLLDSSRWVTPDASIITLLASRSQLDKSTVLSLAPKDQGTCIEGLAALPSASAPGRLVLGFRNPQVSSQAILVTLLNPDAVLTGAQAQFGEAIRFDLGGHGIRGMAWSEMHNALLFLSGPRDASNGPFALWRWSGAAGSAPVKVQDITAPANSAPEAVVPYAGTLDVQVLFDMGSFQISGGDCKNAATSSQYFTDVIVHVD